MEPRRFHLIFQDNIFIERQLKIYFKRLNVSLYMWIVFGAGTSCSLDLPLHPKAWAASAEVSEDLRVARLNIFEIMSLSFIGFQVSVPPKSSKSRKLSTRCKTNGRASSSRCCRTRRRAPLCSRAPRQSWLSSTSTVS